MYAESQESVFWPRISDDICKAVERCGICQLSSRAAKPIGNISKVPPHLWHTLGTDLFYWNRINFIIIGDYFRKSIIFRKLPKSSTHTVIKELGMVSQNLDDHSSWEATMDHATVPENSSNSLNSTKFTMSQAAHTICRAKDSLKLLWEFWRSWCESPSKMGNRGTMDWCSIMQCPFPAPSHHHLKLSQGGNQGFTRFTSSDPFIN